MTFKRYHYFGPQSAVSLRIGENELLDVQLMPNQLVELPAEHEYTQVLLSLDHLKPQADAAVVNNQGANA